MTQTQVVGVAYGPPMDYNTFSGVPRRLFTAMDALGGLAGLASCRDVRWTDAFGGLVEFSPLVRGERPCVSARWLWKRNTVERLSRRLSRQLAAYPTATPVLQVGTHTWPVDEARPYFCLTDMTIKQAADAKKFAVAKLAGRALEEALEVQQAVLDRHTRIFTICEWARKSIIEDYGLAPERVVTVGVGTNLEALPAHPKKYEEPNVLFVGIDWERKGGPLLVETFRRVRAEIPNARLHIVGCSPDVEAPGVEVHGVLRRAVPGERAKFEKLYGMATCFSILPDFDPFPNVLFEAQRCGTPIVTFDAGSRRDAMIVGETGLLAEEATPEALAPLFASILGDPTRARQMGEAGRRFVESRFTWPAVARRLLDEIAGATA